MTVLPDGRAGTTLRSTSAQILTAQTTTQTTTAQTTTAQDAPRRVASPQGALRQNPASPPVLLGRARESARLVDLLDAAATGSGGALLLRGPAGIGKSSLLAVAQQHAAARNTRVLRATGVPAEARMPFSGLHQLVRPLLTGATQLSERQNKSLHGALDGSSGDAGELFAVALATLELLADAATATPLLLLVDDIHWLDQATAGVLGFVARRIALEPVAVLFALREGESDAFAHSGLPELFLGPLDDEAAQGLLTRGAPLASRELRERVLLEAAGNPLALLELPAVASAVSPSALAGAVRLPVGARLEQAFAARLSGLPDETRCVLLAASAGEGCSLAEILAVAAELYGGPVGLEALEPAVAAGLIEANTAELRFRHPLMASAVYHGVPVAGRVAAHRHLADILKADPDRRMWHRASAAIGSDVELAAQLREFASRTYERGAVAVAVAALERAALLSPGRHEAGVLLLRAAELNCELGRYEDARAVLARTRSARLEPADRARLTLLEEMSLGETGSDTERVTLLVRSATTALEEGERDVAGGLLWAAASRCWWNCPDETVRELVARAAERADPEGLDVVMLAVRAYATPVERGAFVLERLAGIELAPEDLTGRRFLASAAMILGENPVAAELFVQAQQLARAQGRLGLLTRLLAVGAWAQLWTVHWDTVVTAAAEIEQIATEAGDEIWLISGRIDRAVVAGLRGHTAKAEADLAACQAHPAMRGARFAQSTAQLGRGLAAMADGRHSEGFDLIARTLDPADSLFHYGEQCWGAMGYLAEAARAADRVPEAREHLLRLEPIAARTPSSSLHIGMRYARAVLAPDADALPAFEAALAADLSGWPFEQGRLLLAHGQWLRRARRPAESRPPLRRAREIFDSLGAPAWGERARQELRAAGESSAERTTWAREELTPQELQIAMKAAQGMTNREIAQDLYISHRTVGAHLYRVFPKLGITTRAQLAQALDRARATGTETETEGGTKTGTGPGTATEAG